MRNCKTRAIWFVVVGLILSSTATADTPQVKETPVGLVLSAGGAKLLRADTETPLDARPGDLLFARDGLRTAGSAASFLFCPGKTIDTLSASGEVRLEDKAPKVKTGKISEAPARACTLPQTLRVAAASQQHYGVTMSRGDAGPSVPRDKLPPEVIAELAPFDAALKTDPNDQASLIAEAMVFENRKLFANAYETYNNLLKLWPDAEWLKAKRNDVLQASLVQNAPPPQSAGKTYALLVGISKYAKPELQLQYANADANVFGQFMESPRGGQLSPDNVMLLTDDKATTAAVRLGFNDFLKRRATKADTVIILVASHGIVESPGSKNAYILTYDSDPQDLKSTALAMQELQSLFEEQLAKVGRVVLFVDVCKSGAIGTITSNAVNSTVENLKNVEGDMLGLMSARRKELSLEGPDFGGGHGVFSYFVLKGLQGAADDNGDGVVDGNELIRYVITQVPKATGDKQHPTDISPGTVDVKLADVKKPGINLSRMMIFDARSGEPRLVASATPDTAAAAFDSEAADDVDQFRAAINAGRILPDQPDNAFNALPKLKAELNPEQYTERTNELRVALENKAQEVLLQYLQGEATPQTRDDFQRGGKYMEAARTLTQESLFLEGRYDFFQGRALLFDKSFPQAAKLLEQAVRIDPGAAYGFNALGISYLEQAQYEKAIPAFRDASHRAVHWSYPLHNLALAYTEVGDYKSAIKAYQDAIKLTPQYSYLPYNLGTVYQRLNRRKDAEASFKKASQISPDAAEPYNALGTLKASEGKRQEAEQLYRQALQKKPDLLPARHNLAVLLAADKSRQQEAIDLWRENLRQSPDYIPSRLSLAGTLADRGDTAAAIEEYGKVLAAKPGYVAARLARANLLAKTDPAAALVELREVTKTDAQDFAIFEQIGDLEAGRKNSAEAKAAYQSALSLAPDRGARKRIGNKLKSLP
ncbi:MAG TPA: tetratricopeptide repeat protein [Bryobacteraceae bacterium]|nr:tetratricopeptide repeat protein [Bryobacteraceae bacterium]